MCQLHMRSEHLEQLGPYLRMILHVDRTLFFPRACDMHSRDRNCQKSCIIDTREYNMNSAQAVSCRDSYAFAAKVMWWLMQLQQSVCAGLAKPSKHAAAGPEADWNSVRPRFC